MGYLPDNAAGRQLLTRYKVAWWRGLSLDVGYSVALQKDHQVRWIEAVPHKTSLKGGAFGFPDPNFLARANHSLDQIGIPDADTCLALLFPPPPQEEEENIYSTPVDDFYKLPTQLVGVVPLKPPTSTFGPKAALVVIPPPKESSVSAKEEVSNKNAAEERRKKLENQEKRNDRRRKAVNGVVAVARVAGRVAGAVLEGASNSGSGHCGCDNGGCGGDGGGGGDDD